ncbi:flagellar hook-basal body complex protein [Stratiformator vulcanicus]|uniref:Flagellar hook protein FlgE n=1 Tax=Stratiformator vulcanicus TaxID=2527980 RepID=A0A517R5E7_9PLAN|nr:flagellar hook-basal body complex protein [Stratiformator vulcanicus]QDT39053.1 Flagellar hook protein FlgE [Stratiformator vulcanicus]
MGLTSALNTALNGLTLNETSIDVLGNNIANAGTNGFKSSNVLFMTQLSRTLSVGSRPTTTNGGTNPRQIGLGATTSAIVKDFTQGSVTNSTSPSDLAIQGEGFFVLAGGEGNVYSRAGNFSLNSSNILVNPQGLRVQGYAVNDNFELITTTLDDIRIPLGELNVAQRTQNITLDGALLPTGIVGTQGSVYDSGTIQDSTGTLATTSLLSNIQDGGGTNLFTVGETLSFSSRKGGRTLEPVTLDVGAATTLAELMTVFEDGLGIHTGGTVGNVSDGAGGTVPPGVALDATGPSGTLQFVGNAGTVHEFDLATGDLTSNGASVPLSFTQAVEANGESTITDFVVYDSLGTEITVKMTAVLEQQNASSTVFRWYVDSDEDSRSDTAIANGTITFDSEGNVIDGGTSTFALQRDDTAAISPMQISANFANISGISSDTAGSTLSLDSQDGSDPGTLTNFVIDESGTVNGVFDNGIIRTLGQAVLARFSNPQGLVEAGSTNFREGVSSGPPQLVQPGEFGAGTIRSGAIELSNTDIGRNLVDLIVSSTNYRGNARVISSVQELVDELLVLGR